MHDQKKGTRVELDSEQQAELDEKIVGFKALYADCFARRDAKSTARECLEPQVTLLTQNPECFSMWSHRRRVFEALWAEEATALKEAAAAMSEEDRAAAKAAMRETAGLPPQKFQDIIAEIKFNTKIITKDYKCYAAWTHRRWILNAMSEPLRLKVLSEENAKLEQLLRADERNFHAWGYRRWVVTQLESLGAYTPSDDLGFCEAKLLQNFSNYSAWHNRALVTSRLAKAATTAEEHAALESTVSKDLDMVVRAFYCDPADQSAWMYVPALLRNISSAITSSSSSSSSASSSPAVDWKAKRADAVSQLANAAYELAEDDMAEDDRSVKWPLWLLSTLATAGDVSLEERPLHLRSSDDEDPIVSPAQAWIRLADIDPLRRGCFLSQAAACRQTTAAAASA